MDLRCISADSHIVEPPNCYVDFIDPKFRDTAPRVVRHADAGYPEAIDAAKRHGIKMPMLK